MTDSADLRITRHLLTALWAQLLTRGITATELGLDRQSLQRQCAGLEPIDPAVYATLANAAGSR